MMQLRAIALVFAMFTVFTPFSRADDSTSMKPSDDQILSKIHHANQGEISMARLAESRSKTDSVLGYARRIVDDHKKADQQTMDLADRAKLKIATIPPTKEESANQAKLSSLSGEDFDREFLKVMQNDHNKVISWLGSAQKEAHKGEVKDFISTLLPTLHHHHDLAVMVEKQEKKTT